MENKRKVYTAPQLTVVNFKSERGYVGSNDSFYLLSLGFDPFGQIESYTDHEEWTQSGDFWI